MIRVIRNMWARIFGGSIAYKPSRRRVRGYEIYNVSRTKVAKFEGQVAYMIVRRDILDILFNIPPARDIIYVTTKGNVVCANVYLGSKDGPNLYSHFYFKEGYDDLLKRGYEHIILPFLSEQQRSEIQELLVKEEEEKISKLEVINL